MATMATMATAPHAQRVQRSDYDLGIAGGGVMGTGIAQCAVQAGLSVVMVDLREQALQAAQACLNRGIRLARMISAPPETIAQGRLECSTKLDALGKASFVVESVPERIDTKRELFSELDRICPPEICLASNTSAIPIAMLASATQRPTRILGIHFMNPVPLIGTVELVRGPLTSDETLATARALLSRLGKQHVAVHDGPGFVGNRVLMLAVNEAIAAAAEEKAAPAEIDRVFVACLGHRMGPLATADLIGLDVVLDSLSVLTELVGARYRPHPQLLQMVARGELGCKTGQGFFSYPKP